MKCSHDNEAEKLLSRLHFMTNNTNREGNKNAYCPRNTNHLTGALSKWIKNGVSSGVLDTMSQNRRNTGVGQEMQSLRTTGIWRLSGQELTRVL